MHKLGNHIKNIYDPDICDIPFHQLNLNGMLAYPDFYRKKGLNLSDLISDDRKVCESNYY